MKKPIENIGDSTFQKKVLRVIIIIGIIVFLIPAVIIGLIVEIVYRIEFLIHVIKNRKRIIFVNSDSPIWHDYLENKWVPRIKENAIILNWSERKQWNKTNWEIRAFHHWGRDREMNPLFIIFRSIFHIQVFRLYDPFTEYKHGKEKELFDMEKEIEKSINSFIK
jgi:hypothetical protein